ncbi:ribonuclease HI [Desulfosarcina sp. OttesenSCG-928-A07]|nr:ribonuclease HI [Desulfosarcina sp. OttesenSCG-928-G17]MDL2328941.1 ribonuclease HI [Desulfosarcina sp. OttesenSCG-928-A07]
MTKKKFYAVAVGHRPGIYTQWFGAQGAYEQVNGVSGARFKGFVTLEEAKDFIREHKAHAASPSPSKTLAPSLKKQKKHSSSALLPEADTTGRTIIYTDGASLGNPGPGGYGAVVASDTGAQTYELSGGFRRTTNNRMELLACIKALESLKGKSSVVLYSDSRYVVDGMTKKWAARWKRHQWKKSTGEPALNVDLWSRLLDLCDYHTVSFVWVRGHAGTPGNERCDQLATQAAARPNLPEDEVYESGSG